MIILYIVILYVLLLLITPEGYYRLLPSFVPTYPNNLGDLKKVIVARKNITPELIEFHKRTDPSVAYAFYDFLKEKGESYSLTKLQSYITTIPIIFTIYGLKLIHNRKRAYQYVPGLNLDTTTGYTPSYPAGHAYQAFTLAKLLSKEYPKYSKEFINIAEKCDYVRIAAGLHYPSDGEYSRWLVGI